MHLVGARFADRDSANATMEELRDQIPVEPGDLGLRPLGSLHYEHPEQGLIVAGRFELADLETVVRIMQRHGGEIVFRRAEWRTPRPYSRGNGRSCARCQGLTGLRR